MKKQKVALINNYSYCKYPEGINNIKEFVEFLNQSDNSFIELESFVEEGCVAPFYIEEDLKTEKQYWNILFMRSIKESEVTILRRCEYEERLEKVIKEKCINCVNYSEDVCVEDFRTHIEKIDLNGECYGFERKKITKSED